MTLKQGAKSELTFVGSLFALGLIVFWDTWRTELPEINLTISPTLFPYIGSILLMVLSTFLFIQVLRGDSALPEGLEPGARITFCLPTSYRTRWFCNCQYRYFYWHFLFLRK